MARDKKKADKLTPAVIGNAGEYYIMAELLRRGWLAGLTPRNAPAFDILAMKADIELRIRVKTSSRDRLTFFYRADNDGTVLQHSIKPDDFTILVSLPESNSLTRDCPPKFWITATKELEKEILRAHDEWLAKGDPRTKQPRIPNNTRTVGETKDNYNRQFLEDHLERWDLLETGR